MADERYVDSMMTSLAVADGLAPSDDAEENHPQRLRLLARAMRILSQRDHSEVELRRKLRNPPLRVGTARVKLQQQSDQQMAPEVSADDIEWVVSYCHQHNWLDDVRFAARYIAARSQRGYGSQRICAELLQKGLVRQVVVDALQDCQIDWERLASKLAERKFGSPLPTVWQQKTKVMRYLMSRGFFSEEIEAIYRDFND
jgi:regulatory protein